MAFYRRDDFVQNGLGYAVPNAAVTYYFQPGLTLADIYSDPTGSTAIPNPQYSDGLGHAVAYMAAGEYTITYSGPQLQTLTLPDQSVGPGGSGAPITSFAGTPSGTIDGINKVFTFPVASAPSQFTVWLNFAQIPGTGYTSSWASGTLTIAYTNAPVTGDVLYVQGFYAV